MVVWSLRIGLFLATTAIGLISVRLLEPDPKVAPVAVVVTTAPGAAASHADSTAGALGLSSRARAFVAADFDAAFLARWRGGGGVGGAAKVRAALVDVLRPRLSPELIAQLDGVAPWSDALALQAADGLNAVVADATGLVPAINARLGARGSGVAGALVGTLSLADARLLQWLVLQFDDAGVFDDVEGIGGARTPDQATALSPRTLAARALIQRMIVQPLLIADDERRAGFIDKPSPAATPATLAPSADAGASR